MSNTKERMQKVVREHLGLDRDPVDDDLIDAGLGADSLDRVELIMAAEEEFGCNIPDGDILDKADLTFGEMVAEIEQARDGA